MRSKQRRTYRQNQQQVHQALTPNPYVKYQNSPERIQNNESLSRNYRSSQPIHLQSKQKSSKLDLLTKQNSELRKELIELKVHQFYHFDDEKLKQLIKELESLRKEVKKYKEMINDMQMENDFLKRTNIQLKLELQKEIQVRTKDAYAQDISKCTLKYANNKSIDDQVTHLGSTSGINFLQNTTMEDPFDTYKPDSTRVDSRVSRKNLIEKCLSPRRTKDSTTESANQYLLYRRNKEKNANLLEKLNE